MYRAVIWNKDQEIVDIGDVSLVANWQKDSSLFIWLDAYDNKLEQEKHYLKKIFDVHDYAISDIQRTRHQPKIEFFKSSEIIILKELRDSVLKDISETIQLALITGNRFIVSRRTGPSAVIDSLWSKINTNRTTRLPAPRSVALHLSQHVADNYIQHLLTTEEQLDSIGQLLFQSANDKLLFMLIGHQTQLRKAHRTLLYHKQLFTQENFLQFSKTQEADAVLWNNVYEHSERSHSLALLYYELSSDLIDGHISISSHRLNQVMKVLTLITAVFVPLSFLAGIYGMNFENMPELKMKYGYFFLLGIMFSIVSVLLFIFKRKKWLS